MSNPKASTESLPNRIAAHLTGTHSFGLAIFFVVPQLVIWFRLLGIPKFPFHPCPLSTMPQEGIGKPHMLAGVGIVTITIKKNLVLVSNISLVAPLPGEMIQIDFLFCKWVETTN